MKHLLQASKTVILSLFLASSFSFGETTMPVETEPSGFLNGVKAYQAKDYQKAKDIFKSLSEEYPDNPSLLFNLGLSEFQLGHQGLALGLWHQALFLDRSFSPALEAINYAENKLFPEKKGGFLLIHSLYSWLTGWPLHLWILLSLTSFFWFFLVFHRVRDQTKKIPFNLALWSLFPYSPYRSRRRSFFFNGQRSKSA